LQVGQRGNRDEDKNYEPGNRTRSPRFIATGAVAATLALLASVAALLLASAST